MNNKDFENGAALTPTGKLVEALQEVERMIHNYEHMFGTIVNGIYHEHCHSITYLKGRRDGIKEAIRIWDV